MRLDEIGGQRKITHDELATAFDTFYHEVKDQVSQGNFFPTEPGSSVGYDLAKKNLICSIYVKDLPSFKGCKVEFFGTEQRSNCGWSPAFKDMGIGVIVPKGTTEKQLAKIVQKDIDSIFVNNAVTHEFVHLYQSHILGKDSFLAILFSSFRDLIRIGRNKRKSPQEIEAYTLEHWLLYRSLLKKMKEYNYNREQAWKYLYEFGFREKVDEFVSITLKSFNGIYDNSVPFKNGLKEIHQKVIDLFNQLF